MSTHKEVDGKTLDVRLLTQSEWAARDSADGRIPIVGARKLMKAIEEDGVYTDVERDTVEYIRKNQRWTEEARNWFEVQLALWLEKESQFIRMTPEALCKEHFGREDVLKEDADQQKRKKRLQAATMETYQDHDEIGLIVRLANGTRVEVTSNFIELEEEFVELRGGYAIPVRAIEKVRV